MSWLTNAWRIPELRKRVLFTAMIIGLYRLGSWMPAPGVDSEQIKSYFSGQSGTVLGLLNLFSGGALSQFSLFALGIMPYVTASIILQLLTVVVPTLERLQKEGEAGYAKINQYTRYSTVALAAVQSLGYAYLFKRQNALQADTGRVVLIVITLTAGTTMLMWMGELITKRGVGNGISIIIFCSIIADAPTTIRSWLNGGPTEKLFYPLIFARGHRRRRLHPGGPAPDPGAVRERHGRPTRHVGRLDLHAAAREHGRRDPDHLRGCGARVPADDRAVLPADAGRSSTRWFTPSDFPYLMLEAFLIIIFTYFYTAVQFNPIDQADNLRKHGGYIPGIRPGPPTAQYLDRVLSRLTLPGSIYLALVAILPTLFVRFFDFSTASRSFIGGTSLLILVGVALDTMRQMESQMMMRSYEGFLK